MLTRLALAAAFVALAYAAVVCPRRSLTFEQRWAPVELIDGGAKGPRLDRPAPAVRRLPAGYRLASSCTSFCEFP
jgi:hypothetical protein